MRHPRARAASIRARLIRRKLAFEHLETRRLLSGAAFLGTDTTTQGYWQPAYGSEGYAMADGEVALPSYATVGVSGFTSSNPTPAYTTQPGALWQPASDTRLAALWFASAPDSLSIDIHLIDGQAHRVALYLLDLNGTPSETVDVVDDATGSVLDTESASHFEGGEYLSWDLAGDVTLRVTGGSGSAPVASGLFFGAGAAGAPSGTASLSGTDTTTQGYWQSAYGSEGYNMADGEVSLPAYATVGISGSTSSNLSPMYTAQPGALWQPASDTRIAAQWFEHAPGSLYIDIHLTDGQAHRVALYALDRNGTPSETVDVVDDATGAVLDTESVSNFQDGEYLSWDLTGDVTLRVTGGSGSAPVASGLFFGAGTAGVTPSGTASLVGTDTTTQGNWQPAYGSEGYAMAGGQASLPSYASVGIAASTHVDTTADGSPGALIQPGTDQRLAAQWYWSTPGSIYIDIHLTDGQAHRVALYVFDLYGNTSETVDVVDDATGAVLDTEAVSNFQDGEYLSWVLAGDVTLKVTGGPGLAAVASGLFFDSKPQLDTVSIEQNYTIPGSPLIVVRHGDLSQPLTVTYSVSGTAVPGVDYPGLSGSVYIQAGTEACLIPCQTIYHDWSSDSGAKIVDVTLNSSLDYQLYGDDTQSFLIYGNSTGGHNNQTRILYETPGIVGGSTAGTAVVGFSGSSNNGLVYMEPFDPLTYSLFHNPYSSFVVWYAPNKGSVGADTVNFSIDSYYIYQGVKYTQTKNVTQNVYVLPDLRLDVFNEPVGTADDSQLTFEADASAVINGNDEELGDGSIVQWTIRDSSGGTQVLQTPTAGGVADCTINSDQIAGTTYTVDAQVIAVSLDGGPVTNFIGPDQTEEETIVPGQAANISFSKSKDYLISDGQSQTTITLTARDAEGNLVADGSEIDWDLAGGGQVVTSDPTTLNGKATLVLQAGVMPEDQTVSATIDGYQASTTVTSDAVNISLGITGNVVTLGSSDTALVTATVTDAEGNPVPNGTPITWYTQKGTIVGNSTVVDGMATASLYATGGSQIPGNGVIKAFVGSNVGSVNYLFVNAANQVNVGIDHPLLAGDATTDGSFSVDQADGSSIAYDYSAGTNCTITIPNGQPGIVVVVTVGNGTTPGGLLTVAGDDGIPGTTAKVTLNALGQASFRLQSTGALPAGQAIVMPIGLAYDQSSWLTWFTGPPTPIASFNVALQPAEHIGRTLDYIGKLGWSILAGPGDSADEIAADMAFSFIPGVGVYSDLRDAGAQLLKLWPGGEDLDWWAFGLAAAGIVAEFTPADLALDVMKAVKRASGSSVVLVKTLVDRFNEAAQNGIDKLGTEIQDTITYLATWFGPPLSNTPAPALVGDQSFAAFAGQNLIKNPHDLDVLQALSQKMDGFNDFVAGIASKYAPDVTRRVQEALGKLTGDQISAIQDAGKMDDVVEAIKFDIGADKVGAYAQWLDDVKLDPSTPIPAFPKSKNERLVAAAEASIDSYLRGKGEVPQPNLLSYVDGRAGKQGDRYLGGTQVEYKSISNITSNDIPGAIASRLNDASKQASVVVLDVRKQANVTLLDISEAVRRARIAATLGGRSLDMVRVILTDTTDQIF